MNNDDNIIWKVKDKNIIKGRDMLTERQRIDIDYKPWNLYNIFN